MVTQAANLGILETRVIPELTGQLEINQDLLAVFMKLSSNHLENGFHLNLNMEPILTALT
jgi:hypothetical protein